MQHTHAAEIWAPLPKEARRRALDAGLEAQRWLDVLARNGDTLLTELLRGVEELDRELTYPNDTAEDDATHSQYYFHSHRDCPGEYGHIHLYRMAPAVPADWRGQAPAPRGEHDDPFRTHSHLAALSLDRGGQLIGMFTLNCWSSHETLYSPEQMLALLDGFDVSHAYPSWPINRWIHSVLVMYRPLIAELFERRARRIAEWRPARPDVEPWADEDLEVTSEAKIDFGADLAWLADDAAN